METKDHTARELEDRLSDALDAVKFQAIKGRRLAIARREFKRDRAVLIEEDGEEEEEEEE